jgi:hypothetical protein
MKSSGIENIVAGFREWVERMARKDIRADYHLDWNHSEKCGSPGPQCSMWITPPQPMHLLKTSFFFFCPQDFWLWIMQFILLFPFSFMKVFDFCPCFLRQLFHFTDRCYVVLWQDSAFILWGLFSSTHFHSFLYKWWDL